MTADDLRELAKRQPFAPFTVHMNDGSRLTVTQPDNFFAAPAWKFDAIIAMDDGRWSIIYTRNVAHVTPRGGWPKMSRKKRRGSSGNEDEA